MIRDAFPGSIFETSEGQFTFWLSIRSTEYWTAPVSGDSYSVWGDHLIYDIHQNMLEYYEEDWRAYTYILGDGDSRIVL